MTRLGKHLNDDGTVDKETLAKELVNKLQQQQKENLKELGYDGSILLKDFVLYKKDIDRLLQKRIIKDMSNLIGSEGKIKYGFVGFTYRAIDSKTKFFQTGLSFAPDPYRLNFYLRDCVFHPEKYQFKRTGTKQIYGWIAKAIDDKYGLQTFKEEVEKGSIKSLTAALDDLFDFEITGVFWAEKLVRDAENEQIAVTLLGSGRKGLIKLLSSQGLGYDITNPARLNVEKIVEIARKYGISKNMIEKGLNDPSASGKGGNPENAEKFIWDCAYCTALGLTQSQMHEKMAQKGFYIKSFPAFIQDYKRWFGSIKRGRELFLNPIIESLKELHGYSQEEINELYPVSRKVNKEMFIHMAEENYKLRDISKIMGYSRVFLSEYAKELIVQVYDFIEQSFFREDEEQKSFRDLQYYLLAQKILRQAMNNIPRKEIMESFEGGIAKHRFSEVHKKVLHTQTFTDLQNIARESLLNTLIADLNPSKVSDIANDDRCWMSRLMVYRKINEFYKDNPLVQRVLAKKHLTPLEMAKVAVIGTELEKFYKMRLSNMHILKKFNKKYILKDIIDITKLIWDLDPDSVRAMLHAAVLKEK